MLKYITQLAGMVVSVVAIIFAKDVIKYMQSCFAAEETTWLGFLVMLGYFIFVAFGTFLIVVGDDEKEECLD